jgi:hypothetical protein
VEQDIDLIRRILMVRSGRSIIYIATHLRANPSSRIIVICLVLDGALRKMSFPSALGGLFVKADHYIAPCTRDSIKIECR